MPLFEFDCRDCGRGVELLVPRKAEPDCPECGSGRLEKRLSVVTARTGGPSLPVVGKDCPPPSAGPCGTGCCRLPG